MASRMSNPASQFFDKATGAPLSGGQMFFFEPGTDTPKSTFSDSLGTVANTNPVILSANGILPDVFGDGSFRVVLKASPIAPATVGVQQWVRDPVIFEAGGGSFSQWNETETYEVNEIVEASDGAFYIAIAQNTNANPASGANSDSWSRFDFLNRWNQNESYIADAVVRGSDGIVYSAVQSSLGVDPISDTDGSHWKMFDNVRIDGNTVTVTDTDGDLNLNSNGTGEVLVDGNPVGANITVQTFTANGTWNRPTGVRFAIIEGVGGGGGGGGVDTRGSSQNAQGGGGGGYFRSVVDVTAITSLTVTIGAGGVGVSGAAGASANNTVISGAVALTGFGGVGGIIDPSSGGVHVNSNGGAATGGQPNISGSAGSMGSQATGGDGGSSILGASVPGRLVAIPSEQAPGVDGSLYGSGGSGASASSSNNGNEPGGDGSVGLVIFTEYR